ncbi:MAG: SH3 domain-containing protein [Aggregatilineales bacterium]
MKALRSFFGIGLLAGLFALAGLAGTTLAPARAQGGEAFEIVLYVEQYAGADLVAVAGDLLFVEASGGVTRVPVPAAFYADGGVGRSVMLSEDSRYLVGFSQPVTFERANNIVIADLLMGTCCTVVFPPYGDIALYHLGSFSPDGTRFAASFVRQDFSADGGIFLINATTGVIDTEIPMAPIRAQLGDDFSAWPLIGAWYGGGIELTPSCYACEPPYEWEWADYNLATGLVTLTGIRESIFAERLPASGEVLYVGFNPNFPHNPDAAFGYFPTANVVNYYPDGVFPLFLESREAEPVAYFTEFPEVNSLYVHFIADGDAFITGPIDGGWWEVVRRDGTRTRLSIAPGAEVLAGTPSGWLALWPDAATGQRLRLYEVLGGSIAQFEIGAPIPFGQSVRVLRADLLGFTRATTFPPFPVISGAAASEPLLLASPIPLELPTAILLPDALLPALPTATPFVFEATPFSLPTAPVIPTAPFAPPAAVQCPGFLPSRLAPGGMGAVTPGIPNRLRDRPSLDSNVLTNIPGGAIFVVISGPVCDPAGIAWWQVNYNGIVGWTAEGQGGAYFTEPVGTGSEGMGAQG